MTSGSYKSEERRRRKKVYYGRRDVIKHQKSSSCLCVSKEEERRRVILFSFFFSFVVLYIFCWVVFLFRLIFGSGSFVFGALEDLWWPSCIKSPGTRVQ